MNTMGVESLRDNLRDIIDYVRFENGRVLVTRRGIPVAEIVPTDKKGRLPDEVARLASRSNLKKRCNPI